MSRRIAAVVAGLVAVVLIGIGLVVGLGSVSVSTQTYGAVDCGSAFSPQTPTVAGQPLEPGSIDVYSPSDVPLSQQCDSATEGHRTPALILLIGGVLLGVGAGLYYAAAPRLNSSR